MILTQIVLSIAAIIVALTILGIITKRLYTFFLALVTQKLVPKNNTYDNRKSKQDLSEFIAALITGFVILLPLAIAADLYHQI